MMNSHHTIVKLVIKRQNLTTKTLVSLCITQGPTTFHENEKNYLDSMLII